MAKFAINASGAMLLPSSYKVKESISGSVVPLAMFIVKFLCLASSLNKMGFLEQLQFPLQEMYL